jgi:hypothetical protein
MNFYTFYTYTLWLFASIYGYLKPRVKQLIDYIHINLYNDASNSSISLFVSNGTIVLPFDIKLSNFYKEHNLYYVVVKTDSIDKILVFNSLDCLVHCYRDLPELVEKRVSKFSKFLEVINAHTKSDCLETFIKYTDKCNYYYSDITNYHIKPKDLYDFTDNRFILTRDEKLHITKMDLTSHEYHFEEQLTS